MYIICGLGNPGKEYELTRHNMGFLTIDTIAAKLGINIQTLKFKALIGEGRIGTEKVILVKPQTYMNLSGESLRQVVEYYKADMDHVLVIYDDIDIAAGTLRIRPHGSSGSHNGMKSVIYQLQSDRFPRIRVGIGDHGPIPLDKFVLSKVPENEREIIAAAIKRAADAAEDYVVNGIDHCMQQYNQKTNPDA